MAENLQTTRPADEGWTTVIRPKTGWFDIDLQELWRYRDLIMMFVKRNFTVLYKQTILCRSSCWRSCCWASASASSCRP